jgi:hypothetical protein
MADFSPSPVYISAKVQPGGLILVPPGYQITATVSGIWSYTKGVASCGAAGAGGPTQDNSFPEDGAPIGACLWNYLPTNGGFIRGWFKSDNQTITWGDTSPGDGTYQFLINDQHDHLDDNDGSLKIDFKYYPKP